VVTSINNLRSTPRLVSYAVRLFAEEVIASPIAVAPVLMPPRPGLRALMAVVRFPRIVELVISCGAKNCEKLAPKMPAPIATWP